MMTETVPNQTQQAKRGRCRRIQRRGALTLFVLVFLVVAMLMMMLVLNWVWLVLNNRDMQRRSDLLALVAVTELRDERVLEDETPFQPDDVADARDAVTDFRRRNNQVAPDALELQSANVTVTPGHVPDVRAGHMLESLPYNALRVELHRYARGVNSVMYLIHGFGSPESADITTAATAALDSGVTGFRPTEDVPAPIVPLAIESDAWFKFRPLGPKNANNRHEMVACLQTHSGKDGVSAPNAALVALDRSSSVSQMDLRTMHGQILTGVFPGDLQNGQIGPTPVRLPARINSPENTDDFIRTLNAVTRLRDRRRIFPIFSGHVHNQGLNIVGFVAATVLDARNIGQDGDHQLSVTIEPEFIIHRTAMTDRSAPENPYIHKIRLVQ